MRHLGEVNHCWKYFLGTKDFKSKLQPKNENKNLHYYSDATWADDLVTRKSQSGYISFWKTCPLSWNSSKQKNITLSSTEAEFNALSDASQESTWIKHLIEELWQEKLEATLFCIDNKGLIDKIQHFGSNSKTKHLDIKIKYLRDLYNTQSINVKLIDSNNMTADALTKACSHISLERLNKVLFE